MPLSIADSAAHRTRINDAKVPSVWANANPSAVAEKDDTEGRVYTRKPADGQWIEEKLNLLTVGKRNRRQYGKLNFRHESCRIGC